MKWQSLVLDQFLRIEQELGFVLDGLSAEDLNRQPAPDCNSIGWLAWHLTRSHDRNMSELMGKEQLWISEDWHSRFDRAADPGETGVGHTPAQAAAFICPSAQLIEDYHHAILSRIGDYIQNDLTEAELDRQTHSPTLNNDAPAMRRITGVIQQGFLHVRTGWLCSWPVKGQRLVPLILRFQKATVSQV